MKFDPKNTRIAIIGLGYVGLPLAVEFAKKYPVVGFDIKKSRVEELKNGHDSTLETEDEDLSLVTRHSSLDEKGLFLTTNPQDIINCNYYIVTVPTPIDKNKRPDLNSLKDASKTVGEVLSKNDTVIYESTVYPGATEEDCVPVLEEHSKLKYNVDFFCGYSPERINPGDKVNTLTKIIKVTSGSNPEIADNVDELYKSIITAGTFKATNIKVAEASKAIENAQRDLNISFVNELALIFDKMGINTNDVIEAAATKWNYLKFKPGLVGGHCINVDPYYMVWKAEELGYYPEVIKSGRRVNEKMGKFVANKLIKLMTQKELKISGSNVLVLGFTFKENCPDIRNTRVIDVITELKEFGCNVDVYDPWPNKEEVKKEFNINLKSSTTELQTNGYNAIILAVAHKEFEKLDIKKLINGKNTVVYDLKSVLPKDIVDAYL
ncbi:nucleotide sugar dehydrogenase [Bacteroidota bacterium]